MGIYFNLLRESAVQDPDDVGVDLNAVEEEIAGDNGIAAHAEEIEDAVAGVVEDPLEEATRIMYESEYNFNQIMRVIGITELNEAYSGRDFFLEGENAKGFFASIKETIVNMFKQITKVFTDIIDKIKAACDMHKKYYDRNKKEMEKGYNNGKWSANIYDMMLLGGTKAKYGASFFQEAIEEEPPLITSAKKDIERLKTSNTTEKYDPEWCRPEVIIEMITDHDLRDVKGLREYLKNETFKKKTYSSEKDNGDLWTSVISALNSREDMDKLRKAHGELKKQYNKYLKEIAFYEKEVDSPDDRRFKNRTVVGGTIIKYMKAIQFERGIYNIIFSNSMKAARLRRNQAFYLATQWVKAAKSAKDKDDGNKSTNSEPKNESVFYGIDII